MLYDSYNTTNNKDYLPIGIIDSTNKTLSLKKSGDPLEYIRYYLNFEPLIEVAQINDIDRIYAIIAVVMLNYINNNIIKTLNFYTKNQK